MLQERERMTVTFFFASTVYVVNNYVDISATFFELNELNYVFVAVVVAQSSLVTQRTQQ